MRFVVSRLMSCAYFDRCAINENSLGSIVLLMRPITGVVQHYDWGTTDAIPKFLGATPDGQPWAEYWLGTHHRGPSTFEDGVALETVTGELPYLLKLLSAGNPLSLQTHPNSEQAARGFASGYFADPHPKPELLIATTEFTALCGIRPVDDSVALLRALGLDGVAGRLISVGPQAVIADLYFGRLDAQTIVSACARSALPEAALMSRLDAKYPGEPSVAVTLLLNLVTLEPGEALRLEAGNLHAYVSGTGIELMASSDNVVRGGLTTKPVDVELLLSTLDATPLAQPVLPAGESFELGGAGVRLCRLHAGSQAVADIHSIALRDDGIAFYTAPGASIDSTVGCWVVVGATGANN
jgi:mannose-6-phosphate isomerase